MNDIPRLKREIVRIFKTFDPEKIILFGSRARGQEDEQSDIDLIVVYNTDKLFLDRLKELYVAWDVPQAVDILAYTPGEFSRMMKENLFIRQVASEGEVLYERD